MYGDVWIASFGFTERRITTKSIAKMNRTRYRYQCQCWLKKSGDFDDLGGFVKSYHAHEKPRSDDEEGEGMKRK